MCYYIYMNLEAKPFLIESLVVQEDTTTHELNTNTSTIENLSTDNLKIFMLDVVQYFVAKADENLEKISATLVYNLGSERFLYQMTITDSGVEDYSTNPDVPSEIFTKEMLESEDFSEDV